MTLDQVHRMLGSPSAAELLVALVPGDVENPRARECLVRQVVAALEDPRRADGVDEALGVLISALDDPGLRRSALLVATGRQPFLFAWPLVQSGPARIHIGTELPDWFVDIVDSANRQVHDAPPMLHAAAS